MVFGPLILSYVSIYWGHIYPHLFPIKAPGNSSELGTMKPCLSLAWGMLRIQRSLPLSENLGNSDTFCIALTHGNSILPSAFQPILSYFERQLPESTCVPFLKSHPKFQNSRSFLNFLFLKGVYLSLSSCWYSASGSRLSDSNLRRVRGRWR